uniref:Uncharacterized protein n=1 Tax=Chromera velia CCMP2878 TaxID=1169474 RepID=A0A0G4HPN2_9ALVE|eukprot:Cvel_29873.t1-p1 / transcript=Cvel_29873.t1 / gene=Cvel_29873 / organism=Chromera_velia_CCMP2878 / gene_product=hypothetical protein / transcript_product=hypothetical protein / location=Cvel_scaffold4169:9489-11354(-) / protein_length=622 / sequence_SO=supercontig / SO=protein_coding / is_pseudo=false
MKRGTTMREGTHVLSPSQAVSPPPHAPLTDAQRHPPPYSSPSPPLPGAVQTPPGALPPPRGSMVPQAPIRPHAAIHASPQIASESPQYNAGERIFQGQPAMTSQREMKRSPPKGPPGPPREQKGSRRTLQYCTQKLGVIADGGVQPPLRSQGRASPFASASPPKLALSDPSSKVQTFASRATPLPPPAQGIAESKKGFAGSPLTFQGSPRIIYNGGSPVVSEEAVGSPGKFGPSKQQQSDVRSPSPPFQEGPERPVLHEREDVQFLWKSPSSVGPRGSSETSPGPVEKGPRHDFQSQVGRLVHRQPPTSSGAPSPAGALPLVTDMNALTEMSDVFLLSRSGTRERASGGEQSNGQGGVLPSEEVGTHPPVPLQSPVDFFFVRHALEAAEPPHPIVRKSAFRGQSALSFPSKRPASGSERQPECPKRGRLNRDGIDWSLRIDEERAELGGRPRHVTRTLGRAPSVRVLSPPSPAGERRPSGLSGGLGGMSAKPSLRSIPSVVSLASSARGGGGIASFGGVRVDPPRDREGRRRSGSLLPPLRTPSRPMPPAAVGGEGRERGARATGSEREGTRATAEWVSVARSGPGGTVEGVSGRTKRRSAASARTHILPAVSLLMHSNQTP